VATHHTDTGTSGTVPRRLPLRGRVVIQSFMPRFPGLTHKIRVWLYLRDICMLEFSYIPGLPTVTADSSRLVIRGMKIYSQRNVSCEKRHCSAMRWHIDTGVFFFFLNQLPCVSGYRTPCSTSYRHVPRACSIVNRSIDALSVDHSIFNIQS